MEVPLLTIAEFATEMGLPVVSICVFEYTNFNAIGLAVVSIFFLSISIFMQSECSSNLKQLNEYLKFVLLSLLDTISF